MYQALYRKWRPKTFDEVIGQEHITETLKTQVQTGHLSHAYIFIGTRGTGKTTCARILAKAVNCEHPVNGNPCNCCRFCRGIDDGSILDIVELDAASNTGVDNVRDLREEAVFSPAAARKRVYIIDEVHMLSLAAFNALLKIIEEPPTHLMFILATTELQKVPATILSRCQRHSFRRIPTVRLSAYLREIAERESLQLDEAASVQIGRLAEGGVRDALSILDQCSAHRHITVDTVYETMGLTGNRNLTQLLWQVLQHDTAQALKLFQQIWLDGKEPASLLGELSGLIRDILIVKAAPSAAADLVSGNYEIDELEDFAAKMTKEEILFCTDTVQDAIGRIRQVRNPRMVAEICIVNLCDDRTSETTISLRARISRLEDILASDNMVPEPVSRRTTERKAPASHETEIIPSHSILPASERINPSDVTQAFQDGDRSLPQVPSGASEAASEDRTEEPQTAETGDAAQFSDASQKILAQAKTKLPMELKFFVDDPGKFQIHLENREILLEAVPGFLLERLKKPEVRAMFSDAAEHVLGFSVAVRLSELQPTEKKPVRDINELKKFKEVTFVP